MTKLNTLIIDKTQIATIPKTNNNFFFFLISKIKNSNSDQIKSTNWDKTHIVTNLNGETKNSKMQIVTELKMQQTQKHK